MDVGDHLPLRRSPMNPQLLPAQLRDDVPAWAQTVAALWPFFDRVAPLPLDRSADEQMTWTG
jgi:hypothetical protein